MDNKELLTRANAAVDAGDHEGFLKYCTDDTTWFFMGDITLSGKNAVRRYMAETYVEPPVNNVANLLGEGDYVVARGTIAIKESSGRVTTSDYCDVWRFKDGKMAELHAYVVAQKSSE